MTVCDIVIISRIKWTGFNTTQYNALGCLHLIYIYNAKQSEINT